MDSSTNLPELSDTIARHLQDDVQCINGVQTLRDLISASQSATSPTQFKPCRFSGILLEDLLDAIAASPSQHITIRCETMELCTLTSVPLSASSATPIQTPSAAPSSSIPAAFPLSKTQSLNTDTITSDNNISSVLLISLGVAVALILGIVLAVLRKWHVQSRRRASVRVPEQQNRSSSFSLAKKSTGQHSKGDEESIVDDTTAGDDAESHFDQSRLPEVSFLSQLTEEPCDYGDEETMEGYSISAVDVGTQPSFRLEQQRKASIASFARSFPNLAVQRTVKAPPGKLGVSLVVTPRGPKVQHIKEGSPMEGQLFVGDIVIRINDTVTRALSSSAIYKLLDETKELQRTILVLTMDEPITKGESKK